MFLTTADILIFFLLQSRNRLKTTWKVKITERTIELKIIETDYLFGYIRLLKVNILLLGKAYSLDYQKLYKLFSFFSFRTLKITKEYLF